LIDRIEAVGRAIISSVDHMINKLAAQDFRHGERVSAIATGKMQPVLNLPSYKD
jgi:hypothetical protein